MKKALSRVSEFLRCGLPGLRDFYFRMVSRFHSGSIDMQCKIEEMRVACARCRTQVR